MYQEKAMHCKEKKRSKTLVFLLAVDVCICVCVLLAAWAVFLKEPQAVALAPDVAPSEVEPNQTPIASSTEGESLEIGEPNGSADDTSTGGNDEKNGGGNVSIRFAEDVSIFLTSKTATLYFGNGESSVGDLVVQIVVQEQVLAQSGRLTPGNQVEKLDLVEGAAELLSEGSYKGVLRFHCYDRETGEKNALVSSIPVTVIVQK